MERMPSNQQLDSIKAKSTSNSIKDMIKPLLLHPPVKMPRITTGMRITRIMASKELSRNNSGLVCCCKMIGNRTMFV